MFDRYILFEVYETNDWELELFFPRNTRKKKCINILDTIVDSVSNYCTVVDCCHNGVVELQDDNKRVLSRHK